jgi:signal transduction histidine kinase
VFTADAAGCVEPFYRRALSGESVHFELALFDRLYSISAGPFTEDEGIITAIVAIAQDITATREVQQQLESSEAQLRVKLALLTHENQRKNEFLVTMAHELRQPLQACSGAIALLRRARADEGSRAANVIERQLLQMSRIVSDLMDASRAVRGEVTVERVLVDLRRPLEGAVESVKLSDVTPYRFILSVPSEAVLVLGDGRRLEQVFVNLLTNAAKHTPHDGTIHASITADDLEATVRVIDSGIGIDPSDLAHIFDLFNRGSSPQGQGLGIGLTLARAMVEQHGGVLEASSDGIGRGAEFRVRLPVLRASGQPTT